MTNATPQMAIKKFFSSDSVSKSFEKLLGKKAQGFITSVLQTVNNNKLLQSATPESIYTAAAVAATLDLAINNNLGYAYIVPYGNTAQFQMGYKGYIQLAHRTAQYEAMNVCAIYESQFVSFNPLTEKLVLNESAAPSGQVVGYAAFFRLVNGFEKTSYWTREKAAAHGKRYSKSFNSGSSPWKTHFDEMAQKTVLKDVLSKWGILSIEMQRAMEFDNSTPVQDADGNLQPDYTDAQVVDDKQLPQSQFDIALQNLHTVTEVQQWYMENPDCPESAVESRINELEKQANENAG
jgi:recombination protein RecT